jgi:hypothetical protein
MTTAAYSVFYGAGPKSFFQSKTDFHDLETAEKFIQSRLFVDDGYTFNFMLKNGQTLVKGKPRENSAKFFTESMKFAVDIPYKTYNF